MLGDPATALVGLEGGTSPAGCTASSVDPDIGGVSSSASSELSMPGLSSPGRSQSPRPRSPERRAATPLGRSSGASRSPRRGPVVDFSPSVWWPTDAESGLVMVVVQVSVCLEWVAANREVFQETLVEDLAAVCRVSPANIFLTQASDSPRVTVTFCVFTRGEDDSVTPRDVVAGLRQDLAAADTAGLLLPRLNEVATEGPPVALVAVEDARFCSKNPLRFLPLPEHDGASASSQNAAKEPGAHGGARPLRSLAREFSRSGVESAARGSAHGGSALK